jgi:hypothetical protein
MRLLALCRAGGGRGLSAGWRAGEMVDGLGLAETTPGPLILVLEFVGFLAGFRAPGRPAAAGGRWSFGSAADGVGDLRAVLPLDLPGRALCRGLAREPGDFGGARGDHRGGGRRHRQPGTLVRAACPLPRGLRPVLPRHEPGGAGPDLVGLARGRAGGRCRHRAFALQAGHGAGAGDLCDRRRRPERRLPA